MKQALAYTSSTLAYVILAGVLLGYGGALIFQLDGFAHLRLHFVILALLVAFLAAVVRRWTAVLRAVGAAVLAVAGLAPLWEPAPDGPEEGFRLTVMTANLSNENPALDRARAALLKADADILVTQETTKAMMTGATSLARLYPYRLSLSTSGQILRTVIWSRYPMRDGELMLEDTVEPTGAIAVVDLADGRELLVVGLHMAHAVFGTQGAQIEALPGRLSDRPEPRVLLGDFNATPWSWALSRIGDLSGTRRLPGYRVTWRGVYPTLLGDLRAPLGQPIDHILASPGIGVSEVRTVSIPGSDHLGLMATLWLP